MKDLGYKISEIKTMRLRKIFISLLFIIIPLIAFKVIIKIPLPKEITPMLLYIIVGFFEAIGLFIITTQLNNKVVIYEKGFYVKTGLDEKYITYEEIKYITYIKRIPQVDLYMEFNEKSFQNNKKYKLQVNYFKNFADKFEFALENIMKINGQRPEIRYIL